MEEGLKRIEENSLIKISSSWGLGYPPGKIKEIITQDGKLYYYHNYLYLTEQMQKDNISRESLVEVKKLNDKEMNEVTNFIKKEIVGKSFEDVRIYDVTYSVSGYYEKQYFCIVNNISENGIQKKAEKLFKKIKGGK